MKVLKSIKGALNIQNSCGRKKEQHYSFFFASVTGIRIDIQTNGILKAQK